MCVQQNSSEYDSKKNFRNRSTFAEVKISSVLFFTHRLTQCIKQSEDVLNDLLINKQHADIHGTAYSTGVFNH